MAGIKIPPVKLKPKPGRKRKPRGRKPKVKTAEEIRAAAAKAVNKGKKKPAKKKNAKGGGRSRAENKELGSMIKQQKKEQRKDAGFDDGPSERTKMNSSVHDLADPDTWNDLELKSAKDRKEAYGGDPIRDSNHEYVEEELKGLHETSKRKHGGQIKSSIQQRGWGKARRR